MKNEILTEAEKIFYRWFSGGISGSQYFTELLLLPKPYKTKKWAAIRELILKDSCEICGSKDKLTVSHDLHPETFPVTYSRIRAESDNQYQEKLQSYINQFQTPEGFRRPGLKRFKPEPSKTDIYVLELDFLIAEYWQPELESETGRAAIKEQFVQSLRYISCIDTRTLCGKCAYSLDKRKRNIL